MEVWCEGLTRFPTCVISNESVLRIVAFTYATVLLILPDKVIPSVAKRTGSNHFTNQP